MKVSRLRLDGSRRKERERERERGRSSIEMVNKNIDRRVRWMRANESVTRETYRIKFLDNLSVMRNSRVSLHSSERSTRQALRRASFDRGNACRFDRLARRDTAMRSFAFIGERESRRETDGSRYRVEFLTQTTSPFFHDASVAIVPRRV